MTQWKRGGPIYCVYRFGRLRCKQALRADLATVSDSMLTQYCAQLDHLGAGILFVLALSILHTLMLQHSCKQ
jgi:hypothetical protein